MNAGQCLDMIDECLSMAGGSDEYRERVAGMNQEPVETIRWSLQRTEEARVAAVVQLHQLKCAVKDADAFSTDWTSNSWNVQIDALAQRVPDHEPALVLHLVLHMLEYEHVTGRRANYPLRNKVRKLIDEAISMLELEAR